MHSHLRSSGATQCSMMRETRYAYADTRRSTLWHRPDTSDQIEIETGRMPGIPPTRFGVDGQQQDKYSGGTNLYKVWLHDRNLSCNRVGGKGVVTYRCFVSQSRLLVD